MACPLCGDVCQCNPDVRVREAKFASRSRFQLDHLDPAAAPAAVLIDPDAYDASEERFSASLEPAATLPVPQMQFVPDDNFAPPPAAPAAQKLTLDAPSADASGADMEPGSLGETTPSPSATLADDPNSWKHEVAARLNSYRARRKPRPPKYPSLRLSFEPEPRQPQFPPSIESAALAAACSPLPQPSQPAAPESRPAPVPPAFRQEPPRRDLPDSHAGARIIEFPRYAPPEPSPDELAESICERPRILDAPEIELPPPALGGITLDTEEAPDPQPQLSDEIPLHICPVSRRLAATACDAILVLSACVIFASIFVRMSGNLPPTKQLVAAASGIAGVLWIGYQYLLLTYSGTTLGLRLMRLKLNRFDGSPVGRRTRRWRVIASILSAFSLGLGFAWCFLDEDSLCWHDRITRTYLAAIEPSHSE